MHGCFANSRRLTDMRRLHQQLILLPVLLLLASSVLAEVRVALVIGNNAYQNVPRLEKAVSDARAVGDMLQKIGFKTSVLLDANQRKMNSAVNRFVEDVGGGGIGVIFFAGHGVQINNQNFLLPVDFEDPKNESDVADQAISLQGVQDKLALTRAKFALLVIDACRDNPLPRKAGRTLGVGRGLAQASSAEGQMVVFSAGANQQALDRLNDADRNPNGVFTREFLPWISKPGTSVREAMLQVRSAVRQRARSVNHEQFPAVYDQAEGEFYLVSPPAPRTISPDQAELLFWQSMRESTLTEDFADYLKRYPDGHYASLAQRKLQALKQVEANPAAPAKPEVQAKPEPTPKPGKPAKVTGKPALKPENLAKANPPPEASKLPSPPDVQAAATPPALATTTTAWEYEVIEKYGGNVVGRYRVELGADAAGARQERISINSGAKTLARRLGAGNGLEMQVFRLPNDTNYWITDFSPYLVAADLKPGVAVPVSLPMADMTPCIGEAEAAGEETVKTRAGEFQATRVRVQCRFQKTPQQSNLSTLFLDAWYVPQVGRVVRIDKRVPPANPDDLGEERESYQLKRGPLSM